MKLAPVLALRFTPNKFRDEGKYLTLDLTMCYRLNGADADAEFRAIVRVGTQ